MPKAVRLLVGCILVVMSTVGFAKGQNTPQATKAEVTAEDAKGPIKLVRDEQIALMFIDAMNNIEDECRRNAKHICTLPEMIAGPKSTTDWRIPRLKFDPNKTDPNYTYSVTLQGEGWEIKAVPKKAGLGGFYCASQGFSADVFYNAKGAADLQSQRLTGRSISGDLFWTDQP